MESCFEFSPADENSTDEDGILAVAVVPLALLQALKNCKFDDASGGLKSNVVGGTNTEIRRRDTCPHFTGPRGGSWGDTQKGCPFGFQKERERGGVCGTGDRGSTLAPFIEVELFGWDPSVNYWCPYASLTRECKTRGAGDESFK